MKFTIQYSFRTSAMLLHTFVLKPIVERAEYVLRWSVSLTVDSDMSTRVASDTFQQQR